MLAHLAARGAEDAAAALHRTAALTVRDLTFLCKQNPTLFRKIARSQFLWPVLFNPHPERVMENEQLTKRLELGGDTGINLFSGKPFSWKVPANVVVLNLYHLAQSLRRAPIRTWAGRDFYGIAWCGIGWTANGPAYGANYDKQLNKLEQWGQRGHGRDLPPLCKRTARQWATATKELFNVAYPGNFDQHPFLQELKSSVLGHARTPYGKPGGPGIIRARMLSKVKQAWSSIAALD
jgi:hypothetical protein